MVEGFGTPGLTGTSNWPDEWLWRSVILIPQEMGRFKMLMHALSQNQTDFCEKCLRNQCDLLLIPSPCSLLFFSSSFSLLSSSLLFFPSSFLFWVSIVSLFLFLTGWDRLGAQVGTHWSAYPEDPQHLHPPGQRYPQLLCSQQRESHVHLIVYWCRYLKILKITNQLC